MEAASRHANQIYFPKVWTQISGVSTNRILEDFKYFYIDGIYKELHTCRLQINSFAISPIWKFEKTGLQNYISKRGKEIARKYIIFNQNEFYRLLLSTSINKGIRFTKGSCLFC